MEIRNVLTRQSITSPNQTLIVQKGETYDAVIKESQGGAAVVVIKGIEVQVRTEGEWPQEGRVAIKIVGEQDGVPVARIVPRPPQETDKQPVYFSASEPLSSELRQVGDWLQKHGQSLTKEIVSTLRTFFTEAPGTVEQKLETVRAVINKKLELTSTHLAAVHEALHGKPLGEQFAEIANKLDPAFTLAQREEQSAMKETPHHLAVAADQFERQAWRTGKTGELSSAPPSLAADQSAKAGSTEGTKSSEISGRKALGHRPLVPTWDHLERTVQMETASTTETSTRLQQVREQVAREPSLSKAVEYVRQQVVDAPNVDRDVAEQVDRALREVVQLQRQGRESEARARLIEALVKAEQAARASEAGRQLRDTHLQASQDLRDQIQEVRTQVAKAPDLSKALEQVQKQLVENIDVPAEVREKAAVAVKEAQWLKMNGQEILARRTLVRALEDMERVVQPEAAPATETSTRLQQVREQVAREPNLSKAVEYVRQQVVHMPNVERNVAEQVDRALREVAQLQRQGRESEARARLIEALVKAEQAARASEAGRQLRDTHLQASQDLRDQIQEVRTQVAKAPDLSKALEQVQKQLVENIDVPAEVREKAAVAVKEAQWLKMNGQEILARRTLVRALEDMERVVQPEAAPATETSTRLQQVREQVAREPNLSKAVEYVRQQVVHMPNVERNVAEQVDRALREVAQLQRQGRESEARARLIEALVKAEQAARASEAGRQLRDTHLQASQDLRDQIQEVRTQVAKAPDLSKALEQVQKQLVENIDVPAEVREKAAVAVKEAQWLKMNGQEVPARRNLVQALENMERVVQPEAAPATETSTRLQQVREQVVREPNLSKAVEYVRQQVVDAPNVDRDVVEQVDRALREVAQLQQQGREGGARVRLNEVSTRLEQTVQTEKMPSIETSTRLQQVREQVVREPNLSKAVEYVRQQVVHMPNVERNVAEQVDRALREVAQLQQQGREGEARVRLNEVSTRLEQTVQTEKMPSIETSTRLQQVREQVAREPSLSKAVEYVRQQVVHMPNVERNVAEQVDRALREVAQLQRQGRESEARARLSEALVKAEQAARASEAGRQLRDTHLQASQDLRDQIQEVRTQVAKAPDLSKALEQVQKQLVENIDVPAEVREKAAVAVKEAQWLKMNGQEVPARRNLVQALENMERVVQPEAAPATETSTRLQQVREQVAREPNLSKAVEYVRQQVVHMPNVERNVAEQVDRALREVAQLQRQGRESEARARLIEVLVKAEQAARASEAGRQLRDTHLQASQDLRDQIQEVRTQVAKAPDLSKALEQVQKQLVENIDVPAEVREKAAVAVKEAQWLKMNGQEVLARRNLVQALENMERVVQPEKVPTTEASIRLQQVREQVVREPNLSKAVEYVRQQVVHMPNVERNVAEQVDRTLREVVQLQRQGRESEARARLIEALVKAEQAARASEAGRQLRDTHLQASQDLRDQIQEVRTQVAKAPDLSKALEQVQKQLVENIDVPAEVREKAAVAVKEAQWLKMNGQEVPARRNLVQALENMERVVQPEKVPTTEASIRLQQVREQVVREPNLSKAVEYVRQQVVDAPNVDRDVVEQVDRALREVAQLQQQGREGEARVRLNEVSTRLEQTVQTEKMPSIETSTRLQQVREQVVREPNLSKAVEYVRQQVVHMPNVERNVAEQVDRALREVAQLQQQGREGEARVRLNEVSTRLEQTVQTEKMPSIETSTRLQQVREQVAREPSLSKAVEYVRQQVVHMPNVERNVAEQVDRALREVAQLQRQGRESEARARLSEALVKAEQAARASEAGRQLRDTHLQASQDLRDQIQEVRTQVAKAPDLSKALEQVQKQLVENIDVPAEVREKAAVAVKEAQWLKMNGQEVPARRNLVQALENMERVVQPEAAPATETSTRLQQVREQVAREPSLSKAVEYVRQQVVDAPNVDRDVAEQVDRALREVVQLQRQGREGEARVRLNEVSTRLEQTVQTEKMPSIETSTRLQQVREQVAREPNLSKAVEYVRQQVVHMPNVERNVAEQVDRALREVAQLQRQGRESEARARLIEALVKAEQAARASEAGRQLRDTHLQASQDLRDQIQEVRTQVAKAPDLSKALEQVQKQLVENIDVPAEVREKAAVAVKEAQWLKMNGQEVLARRNLVQALENMERVVQPEKVPTTEASIRLQQVREQVVREPNLSKAVEYVRQQVVHMPNVERNVAEQVDRTLREVVQLQRQGRESEARARLNEVSTRLEQTVQTEKMPSIETSTRLQQVREQVAREPSLSKAVV
ncbi:hypothetical protein GS458_3022 [Geobacillus stearothermophilus]|nr:hypothetical protein GS458_3022 [Geobacillus stearothermophilus]